jgi:CheY-like chemotaxis protein
VDILNWRVRGLVVAMQRMLTHLGCCVTATTSCKEAERIFNQHPRDFDLVVADITMPHKTGDQLAFDLRSLRPDVPVILVTGYVEPSIRRPAVGSGVTSILSKPYDMASLATAVDKALGGGDHVFVSPRPPCLR